MKNIVNEDLQKILTINRSHYGRTSFNEDVELLQLKKNDGIEVNIITYGGRITSIKTLDKKGDLDNVVLTLANLELYENENPFFGAIVGRYGNRIANGKFKLDGEKYILAQNNGTNSLHGGVKGFDKVIWDVEEVKESSTFVSLKLSYVSKDMEEGFPGNLKTTVTYTLHTNNSLDVLYEATTDKTTVVNLTQHSYFNLSGDFTKAITDHEVKINADRFVPVNNSLIPNGELQSVDNSPFDFRSSIRVSNALDNDKEQIKIADGFDHCWVLNGAAKGYRSVATAYHSLTGRLMEVLTDQPGMQFYTGNFLDGTLPIPTGGVYKKRSGFCFETQHFPDSPNQPQFPSTRLVPGEKYATKTTFKFSVA